MAEKKRKLVDANLVTEFGGIEDMESFMAEGPAQRDYTYVPGFSEMRVKRDTDLKRLATGEIRGHEVSTLPVNCRWFRNMRGAGSDPDQVRAVYAMNSGYRAVTKDDLTQNHSWLTGMPPGGKIGPDGSILSAGGDLTLYVIDQQGAARNSYRRKKLAEDMVGGMEMQAGGLGQVAQSHRGADPVVEKKIGDTVLK